MRVVIAYDGSDGADVATALAGSLAWPAGSVLRLVAVVEPAMMLGTPLVPGAPYQPAPEIDRAVKELYEERVAAAVSGLRAANRTVEGVVRNGRPASVLIDEAADAGADLVVAGSRGHGRLARLVLGSVSAELVEHAPCPVLVARTPAIRRIVLASDGSPASEIGEHLVTTWPILDGLPIRVVSVADVPEPLHTGIAPTMYQQAMAAHAEDVQRATREHLGIAGEVAARLQRAGRDADASTRSGDAAAEIIAAAEEADADLVVIGSRGHTGLSRLVLGSVARNVVNGSSGSVLVARQGHAPS